MNKYISLLLAYIIILIAIYLLFSFIELNFNFSEWNITSRIVAGIFMFLQFIFVLREINKN
jgi:hypothetical protein